MSDNEYDVFGSLKDFEPEKLTDNFGIVKAKFIALVTEIKMEDYGGDKAELMGHKFVNLHLIINEGQPYAGRHFFKPKYDLMDEGKEYKDDKTGEMKRGKTGMQKLVNMFWTCGIALEHKSYEGIIECMQKLDQKNLVIRGSSIFMLDGKFTKKGTEGAEEFQTIKVLGIAEDGAVGETEVDGDERAPDIEPF